MTTSGQSMVPRSSGKVEAWGGGVAVGVENSGIQYDIVS